MQKTKPRKGIMLCYPFSEERLLAKNHRHKFQWSSPWGAQPKLNGERGRAIVQSGRCILLSSTEELITTLPHINHQMSRFPSGEYDGELYKHGWTFSRIHSAISTTTRIHEDAQHIEFHIFDLIQDETLQAERIHNIINLSPFFSYTTHIKQVPTIFINSIEKLMELYMYWIDQKYEGFIVRDLFAPYRRSRSPWIMKFKPREKDIYNVIAIIEATSEIGEPLNMVGSFLCVDPEGTPFRVGAGKLKHSQRVDIYKKLRYNVPNGTKLLIEYQTLSDKFGVPHFAAACELIEGE